MAKVTVQERFLKCCILVLAFMSTASIAWAQESAPNRPPEVSLNRIGDVSYLSSTEFSLSLMILIFGLVVITLQFFLLRQVIREKTEQVVQVFTVLLIIIGTLLLISSGFNSDQIAPALGLFGTIAGYLLGKTNSKEIPSKEIDDQTASKEPKG